MRPVTHERRDRLAHAAKGKARTAGVALAFLGAGFVVTAPRAALAQEPPPPAVVPAAPAAPTPPSSDMVILRNGGMLRGRILEILPGDHLTITIETGETRRVGWDGVERVMVAPTSHVALPLPSPQAPPQASPEPPPPPMRGPLIHVHIATPKHVTLNRRLDESASWTHACDSPCDLDLPLGDEYEIAGMGNGPTSGFTLKGKPGDSIVITINPPSVPGIVLGGVLALGGGIGAYTSIYLALVESAVCSGLTNCSAAGFGIAAGVSAGAIVAGSLIIYVSAKTDFDQHQGVALPSPPASAFLREPVWHEPLLASPTDKPAFTIPVFTRTF